MIRPKHPSEHPASPAWQPIPDHRHSRRHPGRRFPLFASLAGGCLLLAACATPAGYDVESSGSDYIRFDYQVAKADWQAMQSAAESHCRNSGRHARQLDIAYLRGTGSTDLWRTVTYACTAR